MDEASVYTCLKERGNLFIFFRSTKKKKNVITHLAHTQHNVFTKKKKIIFVEAKCNVSQK